MRSLDTVWPASRVRGAGVAANSQRGENAGSRRSTGGAQQSCTHPMNRDGPVPMVRRRIPAPGSRSAILHRCGIRVGQGIRRTRASKGGGPAVRDIHRVRVDRYRRRDPVGRCRHKGRVRCRRRDPAVLVRSRGRAVLVLRRGPAGLRHSGIRVGRDGRRGRVDRDRVGGRVILDHSAIPVVRGGLRVPGRRGVRVILRRNVIRGGCKGRVDQVRRRVRVVRGMGPGRRCRMCRRRVRRRCGGPRRAAAMRGIPM